MRLPFMDECGTDEKNPSRINADLIVRHTGPARRELDPVTDQLIDELAELGLRVVGHADASGAWCIRE